jgi:manganese-dependent inorganic pyrophosphatase
MNTSRYAYFAPPISKIMATKVVKFYANELAEDVGTKMMRTRFHAYPIVDENDRIVGCASRYHIMNSRNKKIILVDHNEFSQSVRAIDKAEVLEVIDHHRINDFSTKRPVAFRNEIIGSTATIVATMFRENQIPIPQNLAGLLLGAILSDTLKFQSPTTTEKDRRTANILAAIADLDIDEFAADMFSVGADIKGKSITELLNQDIKYFEIEGCRTMVSQVIISTFAALQGMQEQIQSVLDDFTQKKNLDLCLMVFTSILDNGSVVYRSGEKSGWGLEAFPDKENETHSLQKGILSRKSQIIPMLTSTIKKYS